MRKDHKALIRVFREVKDLQKSITKQIIKAIELSYVKNLRNRNTNTIQIDIPMVLAYLFITYGIIYP